MKTDKSEEAGDVTPEGGEVKDLNIFERAGARLKSREGLAAKVKSLEADVAERDKTITDLQASLQTAEAEAAEGRILAERVAALEEEAETVSSAAAKIAETNHVASSDLPPNVEAEDMVPDSQEALEAALENAKTMNERLKILADYRAAA